MTLAEAGSMDQAVAQSDEMTEAVERAAGMGGDPDAALQRWETLRRRSESSEEAAQKFLTWLRRHDRTEGARLLARALGESDDGEVWALRDAADAAFDQKNYVEALRLARLLAERAPDSAEPHTLILESLRELGRREEADRYLASNKDRFSDKEWFLLRWARVASRARDWPELESRAASLREKSPAAPHGWQYGIVARRQMRRYADAEAMIAEARTRFAEDAWPLREAALLAEAQRQFDAASRIWAELRTRFPDEPDGWTGALAAARRVRRVADEGDLVDEALRKFPDREDVLVHAARFATNNARWDQADELWRKLVDKFPGEPSYFLSWAMVPVGPRKKKDRDRPKAFDRLQQLHEKFPDYIPAYVRHLDAFRDGKRLNSAEKSAKRWIARFPDSVELALAHARVKESQGRFDESLAIVRAQRDRATANAQVDIAEIRLLSLLGRFEEAEEVCGRARRQFPTNNGLLREFARLATRRGDWAEALRRWEEAARDRPWDKLVTKQIRLSRLQLAGEAVARTDREEMPVNTDAALFGRFESLGGGKIGYEFGIVQRHYGSESLGLLRWASITVNGLAKMLDKQFEGVGSDEQTEIQAVPISADREVYQLWDNFYEFSTTTFVRVQDAPRDRMLQQSCRRLKFLSGKMLEDLRAGTKVFVYKDVERNADEAATRLAEALRQYGSPMLLVISMSDEQNAPGTVRVMVPGVLIGYVSGFMHTEGLELRGADLTALRVICTEAAKHLDQRIAAASAA